MLCRYVKDGKSFRGGLIFKSESTPFYNNYFLLSPVYKKKEKRLPFFEGLYLLLEEGNNIFSALQILYHSEEYTKDKKKIKRVITLMERGMSFSQVVGAIYGLGHLELSFLKIAEENGDIKEALFEINHYLTRKEELRNKIKGNLSYPILIFLLSIPLFIIISKFLIPVFQNMYASMGGEIPKISKIAMNMGLFFSEKGGRVFAYLAALILGAHILFIYCPKLEFYYRKFQYTKSPFAVVRKDLFHQIFFMQFSRIYKYTSSAKKTIEMIRDSYSNLFVKKMLSMILDDMEFGMKLADSKGSKTLFTNMSLTFLSSLDQGHAIIIATNQISKFYAARYKTKMDRITKLSGPIIVIFIGIMVAFMVIGTFVPLFGMSQFM